MDRSPRIQGHGPVQLLGRLTALSVARPWVTVVVGVLVTVLSVLYFRGLEYRTGRLDLAPHSNPEVRDLLAFKQEFGTLNRVLVVVEGPRARAATDALVARLSLEEDQVGDVIARVDLDDFVDQLLYTLEPDSLEGLRQRLQDARLDARAVAREPEIATLLERLARRGRPRDAPDADRVRILARLVAYLAGDERRAAPDPTAVLAQGDPILSRPSLIDEEGYLVSQDGRKHLLTAQAAHPGDSLSIVEPFVETIREHGDAVSREFGVRVRYTGLPILKVAENDAAEQSLRRSAICSLTLVAGFFLLAFRVASLPLLALGCLVASIFWTLAWAKLAVGHLTVVSSSFTAILIGLGIDFAIHLMTRFELKREQYGDTREAVVAAALEAAPGILTGCLTTSAAFFAMVLTGFPAFQGLGVIAGGGLLLALVESFGLLPAVLVLRVEWNSSPPDRSPPLHSFFEDLGERLVQIPSLGPLAGLTLLVLAVQPAWRLDFDSNVLNANNPASEARDLQDLFLREFGFFPVQDALVFDDIEQVAEASRLLDAEPTVGVVSSLAGLLPAHPDRNKAEMARIRGILEFIGPWNRKHRPEPGRRRAAAQHLSASVEQLRLLFLARADAEGALAAQQLIDALRALTEAPPEAVTRRERAYLDELAGLLGDLERAAHGRPNRLEDLAPSDRERFHSQEGRFAVICSPSRNVSLPEEAQRFAGILERVARQTGGDATGTVVVTRRLSRLLESGYRKTCLYALLAVVMLVLLDLRRLDLTLAALTTVALGVVATRASMQLCGVALAPANFIIIPLLMGVGVDNAVHLLHPWLDGEPAARVVAVAGRPIFLNAVTSMLGFGGLLLARHPGMFGLGWSMTVGVFWCCVAALLLLPGFLALRRIPLQRWRRFAEDALSHRYP